MGNLKQPLCPFCRTDYDCPRHTEKGQPKPKKTYSIPKVSDKEKIRKSELKKMYPIFLSQPENEMCGLKLKGCLGKATVVHHLKGRIGDQVFEVNDWMASCAWCNIQVENDPLAKEKGLKLNQHSKNHKTYQKMEEKEMIQIARIAIDKNMDFEKLKYSDYMYGKEDLTEEVWEYVEECQMIGTIEFNKKYPS